MTVFVFSANGASASSPGPAPYMRTVTGTLNVLFLVVMQLLWTVPVSHAQLLITTVTVGFVRAVPPSSTWPPNSELEVAAKPIDAKFPGNGLGTLL